jgi:hypothetical protein
MRQQADWLRRDTRICPIAEPDRVSNGGLLSDLRDRCPVQRADLGRAIFIETRTVARCLFWSLLVLADGRLSQPFLPGKSPAAQVSRAGQQSSRRRTVLTDNVPGDRARFREIGHLFLTRCGLSSTGWLPIWPPSRRNRVSIPTLS